MGRPAVAVVVVLGLAIVSLPSTPAYAAIHGTNGPDRLVGTDGDDRILGHGGRDDISGRAGDDVLSGGRGDDSIGTGIGRDVARGGPGHDSLGARPAPRSTVLVGGRGQDIITGPWNDRLHGGPGGDSMSGGLGSVLHGGRGSDFLAFDGAFGTAVLGPGRDSAGFYGDNARGRVRTEDGERDVVECLGRGSRLVVVDSDPRDRFDGRGGCVIVRDR